MLTPPQQIQTSGQAVVDAQVPGEGYAAQVRERGCGQAAQEAAEEEGGREVEVVVLEEEGVAFGVGLAGDEEEGVVRGGRGEDVEVDFVAELRGEGEAGRVCSWAQDHRVGGGGVGVWR